MSDSDMFVMVLVPLIFFIIFFWAFVCDVIKKLEKLNKRNMELGIKIAEVMHYIEKIKEDK